MQNYTEIADTTTLTASRSMLLNNDKTALSNSSGSAFPTTDLQVGMFCFRTDQSKLYQLKDTAPTWQLVLDLSTGTTTIPAASVANAVPVTDDTTTNSTMYPLFAASNSGNQGAKSSSGKFTFNPSTGVLSATTFAGAGTSLTGTAASLTAGDSSKLGGAAAANFAQMAVANTWTAKQTFTGYQKLQAALEKITISATAATGTVQFDTITQSLLYYTANATANFTLNFRGDGSNTLDSLMAIGEATTVVFMNTNGTTAYYPNAITIDGSAVTPKWQGGTAPTGGNVSSIDCYSYTIVKTAAATFTVLASQSQFK